MIMLWLLWSHLHATEAVKNGYNVSSTPIIKRLFEGQLGTINASIQCIQDMKFLTIIEPTLKCWTDYSKVAILKNWTDINFTDLPTPEVVFVELSVVALRLGGSKVLCGCFENRNSTVSLYKIEVATVIVSRIQTIVEPIFRVCTIIFVVFITFVMGCELDPVKIWNYLKRPVSPAIGFMCQFLFMPLIALGLAKLSHIDNAFAFGLLTVGCSPGGGFSNIFTVLFGGDLNLSMTMTFLSSCAALFMMPFWLFILGRFFIDPITLKIPFKETALNLLQVVLPVVIGILVRWKFEKKIIPLTKKVKLISLLFLLYIVSFGFYVNLYLNRLMRDYPILLPMGAALPWLGFLFGYIMAVLTRQTKTQAIAISLETGIQNIGIPLLILKYSMTQPAGDLGALMPIVVAILTPIPLYIVLVVLTVKEKCCATKDTDQLEMNETNKVFIDNV